MDIRPRPGSHVSSTIVFSINMQILRIWVNMKNIALILMPEASHVYRKIGIEGHSTPDGVAHFIYLDIFYTHANPPDLIQYEKYRIYIDAGGITCL